MEEEDIEHCSALSFELTGFPSAQRLHGLRKCFQDVANWKDLHAADFWVCESVNYNGRRDIVGYSSGLAMGGQTVARNEYITALLAESILGAATKLEQFDNPLKEPLYAHVPLRCTQLMLWFAENGWKIAKMENIMSTSQNFPFYHNGVILVSAGGR